MRIDLTTLWLVTRGLFNQTVFSINSLSRVWARTVSSEVVAHTTWLLFIKLINLLIKVHFSLVINIILISIHFTVKFFVWSFKFKFLVSIVQLRLMTITGYIFALLQNWLFAVIAGGIYENCFAFFATERSICNMVCFSYARWTNHVWDPLVDWSFSIVDFTDVTFAEFHIIVTDVNFI